MIVMVSPDGDNLQSFEFGASGVLPFKMDKRHSRARPPTKDSEQKSSQNDPDDHGYL
jgi:hypothetical protein